MSSMRLVASNDCLSIKLLGYLFVWFIGMASTRAIAFEYPVIFTDTTSLRELGLAVYYGMDVKPLKNKCFYYGDGGYLISMSDKFLARFTARGFTVQATCLGLISNTKFDPNTGRRLPTYMIVDRKLIRRSPQEAGAATEELPF